MKKEKISLDNPINEFNEVAQGIMTLKNIIENEINEINNLYEKTNNDLTKSFQKEYEILFKKENDLRERLQNEVTKVKERLENYLSQSSNEIIKSEKIIKNIKNYINKERNILKDLAYISKLNKAIKEYKKLFQEPIKTIKFYYKKEEKNIVYEEYFFNELPIFKNDELEHINDLIINSPIKEDKKVLIEKIIIDDLGEEYDDEDYLNTLNESFWELDGRNFNKEGFDKLGEYFDDDEYIPGAGSEKILNDYVEGEYDDEGFFNTPNGSFWDPDGVYFNREGYDKHGGYYDDNNEYVPGKDWNDECDCYEDEIIYGDYNEYASDYDDDDEENDDNFMNINFD